MRISPAYGQETVFFNGRSVVDWEKSTFAFVSGIGVRPEFFPSELKLFRDRNMRNGIGRRLRGLWCFFSLFVCSQAGLSL